MASPGELVKAVAQVLGVPEPTVVVHDRNLAIAGLRTVGGRGRSAAKMRPRDGASLLTVVAASPKVNDTVETLQAYGNLTVGSGRFFARDDDSQDAEGSTDQDKRWNLGSLKIPELQNLPPDHTFLDALTALLEASANETLSEAIKSMVYASDLHPIFYSSLVEVTFRGPLPRVEIHLTLPEFSEVKSYGGPELNDQTSPLDDIIKEETARAERGDLKHTSTFTLKTILELGKLLKT